MDTVPSFVKELSGYRKQLANPYLVDNEAGEEVDKEAYERLKTEIRASHILISVAEDASPSDTLKAYKRAQSIRQEILDGANFADVARVNSDDPSAKENSEILVTSVHYTWFIHLKLPHILPLRVKFQK